MNVVGDGKEKEGERERSLLLMSLLRRFDGEKVDEGVDCSSFFFYLKKIAKERKLLDLPKTIIH